MSNDLSQVMMSTAPIIAIPNCYRFKFREKRLNVLDSPTNIKLLHNLGGH